MESQRPCDWFVGFMHLEAHVAVLAKHTLHFTHRDYPFIRQYGRVNALERIIELVSRAS